MPREQRLSLSAINLCLHPHNPEKYIQLIQLAAKSKQILPIRGTSHGLLNGAYAIKSGKPEEGIEGEISKFTQIDLNSPWLNTKTSKEANEHDVEKISIPENLKPNYQRFNYVFFPKKHKFVFQTYSSGNRTLSPSFVRKFLDSLFSIEAIKTKFGVVDLTIVPETDSLEKIWKIPQIDKLTLTINRPNPDDFHDEEIEFLEEMNIQHIREIKQEYRAIDGQTITPNTKTKTLAEIAANNGNVYAKGKDQMGKPIKESTKQHPREDTYYFDPNDTQEAYAIREYAKYFL
ncbi:DUF4747 family protein [Candidatus Thiodiazotropha sp. CDECU1]|uniref:DUF4747 family protein n=1 Tax=Candidatus Thiodiazotropha sp. CDECU1 TaxID=3065865 RepID=UPI002931EDF4|nr:DUF4747 family protein [Candidatus Thiodiazotropha sp. CDECU1]